MQVDDDKKSNGKNGWNNAFRTMLLFKNESFDVRFVTAAKMRRKGKRAENAKVNEVKIKDFSSTKEHFSSTFSIISSLISL